MTRRRLWMILPLLAAIVAMAGLMKWRGTDWLGQERAIVSASPSVGPFGPPIRLELKHRGDTLCNKGVTFSPDTQVLRMPTLAVGRPGAHVEVTATAPGYRVVRRLSGWPDGQDLGVALPTPPRSVVGDVCVKLRRRHERIVFIGTQETRTYARPDLVIDGKPSQADVMMTFYQSKPERFADRLPAMLQHISALSWPAAWLLWILVFAVLIGVPAGVLAALWLALRDDARSATP